MEKLKFIAKPKWWWLVAIPWGFLGAYNLYRQEINPNAPPIFDITDDVHWIVWLLIFFIVVAIIIIESLWRYNKQTQPEKRNSETEIEAQSRGQSGGQTIAAQRVDKIEYHEHKAEETTPEIAEIAIDPQPLIIDSHALAENVLIRYNKPELDQFENPKEFIFTIINETGHQLRNCFVILDEVALKPHKKKKEEWQIEEHLVSEKPFIWNHTFVASDGKIYHIDNGDRVSFTLGEQMSRVVREGEYKYYIFNFTFHKSKIRGLNESGLDYRLLISFRATYRVFYDITPASFYVYLQEKSEGVYVFEKLERLNDG